MKHTHLFFLGLLIMSSSLLSIQDSWAQKGASQQKTNSSSSAQKLWGTYSYWVNSMCSQNCDVIHVGPYELSAKLKGTSHGTQPSVWLEGQFETVMVLPTIAGPNSKVKNPSEKIPANQFVVSDFKIQPELKMVSYKNRSVVELNNPSNQALRLKYTYDGEVYHNFELAANGTSHLDIRSVSSGESFTIEILNENTDPKDPSSALENPIIVFITCTLLMP